MKRLLFLICAAVSLNSFAQPIPRQPIPGPNRPMPLPPVIIRPPVPENDVITNPEQFSVIIRNNAQELFTPFNIQEHPVVENGRLVRKGVSPNATITVPTEIALRDGQGNVLRDGNGEIRYQEKQVNAGQYYQELNNFEKFLTDNGYTLRKDYSNIVIKKLVLNQQELQVFREATARSEQSHSKNPQVLAAHQALKTQHTRLATDRVLQGTASSTAMSDAIAIRRPVIVDPRIPAPVPKAVKKSQLWSDHWGWDDKFSAYAEAGLDFYGDMNVTKASAKGEAGGRVFGKKLKLINGDAYAETPSSGAIIGHAYAYVLGFKIINSNYNNSTAHFETLEQSKNFDESTTIHFTLGPIPMSAKIGGQGNAGLNALLAYLPLKANTNVTPNAYAKGYIQVGVDIVVAGAGAGAELKIVEDNLQLVGQLHLVPNGGKPKFLLNVSGNNTLDALRGNMYAYVYIYVPRWGIPPWKKKQWNWNIFEFGGVAVNGSIFAIDESFNLY